MRYAKLVNGFPSYAPRRAIIGDKWVYNPTAEQLTELGYLPVLESEPPETDEQHYAVASWRIVDDRIIEEWSILEIPDYATAEDYENALEDVGVNFDD